MNRRGFSLIELSLVLVILAILAGAVALRLQGPMSHARMGDVAGAVEAFDHVTRTAAVEQDRPLRMLIDLGAGRLSRLDEDGRPLPVAPLVLPEGFRIARVLVREHDVADGQTTISCSRHGLTPTHALLLEGQGQRRWLVFAGLARDALGVDDETQAKEILEVASPRRDAR